SCQRFVEQPPVRRSQLRDGGICRISLVLPAPAAERDRQQDEAGHAQKAWRQPGQQAQAALGGAEEEPLPVGGPEVGSDLIGRPPCAQLFCDLGSHLPRDGSRRVGGREVVADRALEGGGDRVCTLLQVARVLRARDGGKRQRGGRRQQG